MRKATTLLAALLTASLAVLGGCSPANDAGAAATVTGAPPSSERAIIENFRVAIPKTMAFGAPMVAFGQQGSLDDGVGKVTLSNWEGIEQLKSLVASGEVDLAAAPTYVAANLYNKGVDVRLVAPMVWGLLYVAGPADAEPGSWESLRGQKIGVALPGNSPDLIFSYLLKANGLDKEKDIEFVPVQDGAQLVQMLVKGEVDWAVLPEHAMTLALKKAAENGRELQRVLDLQKEWGKHNDGVERFPMAGLVMPGKLVDERPDLVERVVRELQRGVEKANAKDEATLGAIATHYSLPKPVVEQVIPRLQLDAVPARQARADVEKLLKNLGTINPKIYGGQLPDDKFYAGK
ncbi:ABC transporter substrate-binding protein [Trueperella pecoris]|uniref:ABC transporter substrate-binding protein n=1 Tax=Trueperella pecoris TaxID=2733571 RepID=UPI00186B8215|nr:ABC transporter substrate-binding protein [Trueperella pecoris]QOQ39427.1 ABC transporter substrate-binding protein [Trueperella pecoris]